MGFNHFIGFVCLLQVGIGLIVRKEPNGIPLGKHDFGPKHRYQHINTIIGDTLYQRNNDIKTITTNYDASTNPVIYPTDFGADPTGNDDSTAAFNMAINKALSYGASNVSLAFGVHDCGGATIDLSGGDYKISNSLIIPNNYGNLRFIDGTLRASNSFPNNGYLLIIGNETCSNSQGSCNENIGVENMMFDCKLICYGGIHITATMGAVFGPQLFFLGFTGAGVTISGGHETMINNAWFGQFLYSDSRKENGTASTATGIQIFGNDHYVTNTIVFSSKIGVDIRNPANILTGVHTWNLEAANGGTGIIVRSSQNRLIGCYLDYNNLVIESPISAVSIEDAFFLVGSLELRTTSNNAKIDSLSIFDNQFWAGSNNKPTLILNEAAGKFTSVSNMFVKNNQFSSGWSPKSPRASKTLTQQNSNKFTFDFSDILLFDSIDINWIQYSVQVNDDTSFVSSIARKPNGKTVTIELDKSVDATVYVTVDQSNNYDN